MQDSEMRLDSKSSGFAHGVVTFKGLPEIMSPKHQVKRCSDMNGMCNVVVDEDIILQRSPLRNINNLVSKDYEITFTPKRKKIDYSTPVTPNSNFKLLSTVAASLDYAAKDSEVCEENSLIIDIEKKDEIMFIKEFDQKKCRKDKSLALICEKFLAEYSEYLEDGTTITFSLDSTALKLGIERRRIYDIVNILESLDMVKKSGKKQYIWYGRNKLTSSLENLKHFALRNDLKKIVQSMVIEQKSSTTISEHLRTDIPSFHYFSFLKREKSLGSLTRQFLSLFLTEEKPLLIPLDKAAEILLVNDGNTDLCKKATEFKTKVRRLYDVANVLVALKILTREKNFGKPTFKYCGPKLANPSNLEGCAQASFSRTRSENWGTNRKKSQQFVRHSSLQNMCAVAERELEKFNADSNENSNDSTFSFISVGSVERNLLENPAEELESRSRTVQETMSNHCSVLSSSTSFSEKSESQITNNSDVTDSKECNYQEKFRDCKVIKLSSVLQNTVLNSLNLSLKQGKEVSLLISNKENNSAIATDKNVMKKVVLPKSYFYEVNKKQNKQNTKSSRFGLEACNLTRRMTDHVYETFDKTGSVSDTFLSEELELNIPSNGDNVPLSSSCVTSTELSTNLTNHFVTKIGRNFESSTTTLQHRAYANKDCQECFNNYSYSMDTASTSSNNVTSYYRYKNSIIEQENETTSADGNDKEIEVIFQNSVASSVPEDSNKAFLINENTVSSPIILADSADKTLMATEKISSSPLNIQHIEGNLSSPAVFVDQIHEESSSSSTTGPIIVVIPPNFLSHSTSSVLHVNPSSSSTHNIPLATAKNTIFKLPYKVK